ncbi:MAG: hypothetical protein IPL33_16235 [Sphingobacteriales bacterium]|nr:hypothetical protein [Sphingobacteriales bacterium]
MTKNLVPREAPVQALSLLHKLPPALCRAASSSFWVCLAVRVWWGGKTWIWHAYTGAVSPSKIQNAQSCTNKSSR